MKIDYILWATQRGMDTQAREYHVGKMHSKPDHNLIRSHMSLDWSSTENWSHTLTNSSDSIQLTLASWQISVACPNGPSNEAISDSTSKSTELQASSSILHTCATVFKAAFSIYPVDSVFDKKAQQMAFSCIGELFPPLSNSQNRIVPM